MPRPRQPNPIAIKLWPEGKNSLYFTVQIWPGPASMRRHLRQRRRMTGLQDTHGVCTIWGSRAARGKEIGRLYLHRKRLDAEIAAHEISHAALGWANQRGLDLTAPCGSPDNERYCYAAGRMIQTFTNRAYELGIWCDPSPAAPILSARRRLTSLHPPKRRPTIGDPRQARNHDHADEHPDVKPHRPPHLPVQRHRTPTTLYHHHPLRPGPATGHSDLNRR